LPPWGREKEYIVEALAHKHTVTGQTRDKPDGSFYGCVTQLSIASYLGNYFAGHLMSIFNPQV
jgi:hypothetical protein